MQEISGMLEEAVLVRWTREEFGYHRVIPKSHNSTVGTLFWQQIQGPEDVCLGVFWLAIVWR